MPQLNCAGQPSGLNASWGPSDLVGVMLNPVPYKRLGLFLQNCIEKYIASGMSTFKAAPRVVSVTEAATRGASKLVRAAEHGEDLVVERHGKAVAAVVSMAHLEAIKELESDLRESVLLLSRLATDTGSRTDLDQVLSTFGFDRAELEAELDAELASGRD